MGCEQVLGAGADMAGPGDWAGEQPFTTAKHPPSGLSSLATAWADRPRASWMGPERMGVLERAPDLDPGSPASQSWVSAQQP